jgi:heat shock protein HslJ
MTPRFRSIALASMLVASLAACGDDDGSSDSPATLEGTEWTLVADSLDVEVPDGVVVTAAFTDVALAGNSACNTYTTSYTAADGAIELGEIAGTKIACETPVAAVESAYLAELAAVTKYSIDGATLELTDDSGSTSLVFTAVGNGY